MAELTLVLFGTQIDEMRQALQHRFNELSKKAKMNDELGIDSNARAKMAVIEEIARACDPQGDLLDDLKKQPPESIQ